MPVKWLIWASPLLLVSCISRKPTRPGFMQTRRTRAPPVILCRASKRDADALSQPFQNLARRALKKRIRPNHSWSPGKFKSKGQAGGLALLAAAWLGAWQLLLGLVVGLVGSSGWACGLLRLGLWAG